MDTTEPHEGRNGSQPHPQHRDEDDDRDPQADDERHGDRDPRRERDEHERHGDRDPRRERDEHEGHDDRGHRDRDPHREQPKPPLGTRMRLWRRAHPTGTVLLLLAAIALVAGGLILWWYLGTYEDTDDAQIDGHIAALSARVAGTVVAVHVEENQTVMKGDLLVELDPRDYDVALARAQADLLQAQANLEAENPNVPITEISNATQVGTTASDVDNSKAAVDAAQRDYQSGVAKVHAAEATSERAQADLKRNEYLLAQRAITQQKYDEVLATAKAAAADVASARAAARAAQKTIDEQKGRLQQAIFRQGEVVKNAPRQLVIKKASIEAKQAAVKAAEAALARAKLDLEYTRIVAPFDGVVGKRTVEQGQHVQPGEQLLGLVDLNDVWVTANFKETQLRKLQIGQKVRISVDALGKKLDGQVETFAGASGARYSLLPPENATGNYVKVVQRIPVRIDFNDLKKENGDYALRPGFSVTPYVSVK